MDAGARLRQALDALRAGRAAEAERGLRELLSAAPASPLLHYNLGNALTALQRYPEAASCYAQACALKPDFAEAHFNAGNVLRALQQPAAALAAYQRASEFAPTLALAPLRAGMLLLELDRDEEAGVALRRALDLDPAAPGARNALGIALHRLWNVEQALLEFDAAIAQSPADADAWNNRGNAMHDLLCPAQALACFERALQLQAGHAPALGNRGMALQDLQRFEEAAQAYEQAIARRPRHPEAYRRRASLRLLQRDFAPGFEDFAHAQLLWMDAAGTSPPWWRGEPLAGRSILLSEPSGIGDLLLFLRFVPQLLEQGARVSLLVPARLRRLLAALDPRIEQVESAAAAAPCDFQCLLFNLPHWLRLGAQAPCVPALSLQPEPERVQHWRGLLDRDCINVGIAWQGNPTRKIDRGRSIPLALFEPLARVPGVRLVSLQKHHGSEQLANLPEGMRVQVPGPDFDEGEDAFVDTAALLQSLDLVICADTSLTHLAGAFGRPAWVLLNPVPDWRWQLQRSDSPWYPQARLFRQELGRGWAPVLEEAAHALAQAAPALRAARPG